MAKGSGRESAADTEDDDEDVAPRPVISQEQLDALGDKLIRKHAPRDIIGVNTDPKDMTLEERLEAFDEAVYKETVGAVLDKDPTQLTPKDHADAAHLVSDENVLKQHGGLDFLTKDEQFKAISDLRNARFDAARLREQARLTDPPAAAGSGVAAPGGAAGTAAGAGGAAGTGQGSGGGNGGTGDGAGDNESGSAIPSQAVEPPDSKPPDDAEDDTKPPEDNGDKILVDDGTLVSSDPALDGQNADLVSGADGEIYWVLDDGTRVVVEDDGTAMTGGTEHPENFPPQPSAKEQEGDPFGPEGETVPEEFRHVLDGLRPPLRNPDDGATDPADGDAAFGVGTESLAPSGLAAQGQLGLVGNPEHITVPSFGSGADPASGSNPNSGFEDPPRDGDSLPQTSGVEERDTHSEVKPAAQTEESDSAGEEGEEPFLPPDLTPHIDHQPGFDVPDTEPV